MDIAALSMAMSAVDVKQQSSLKVTDKAMDNAESGGNQVVKMIEESIPHPSLGNQIDLKG
ncbi:YjfB family protein [Halobacillus locisalis]|uniref:YjfB family protein n=1 Tax=Halobacillus locisalis TaxID=220753 RepID=A0A838CU11_9BACI|nr:YjfB family protein [Halobacillus locisalis]MBA2175299.1 YjfB family protein [Halobacillus locisalis]